MPINALSTKYNAIAAGVLNNETFGLAGSGEFDLATGRVVGLYEVEVLSGEVDKLFFNAILITGYPSVSVASTGAHNPFCSGGYSYVRSLNFQSGQRVRYRARCVWQAATRTLHSFFDVRGQVPLAELQETLPLVETWEPAGEHQISGRFCIQWICRDGSLLSAEARTLYTLAPGSLAPRFVQSREIRLSNRTPTPSMLAVDQVSILKPDMV